MDKYKVLLRRYNALKEEFQMQKNKQADMELSISEPIMDNYQTPKISQYNKQSNDVMDSFLSNHIKHNSQSIAIPSSVAEIDTESSESEVDEAPKPVVKAAPKAVPKPVVKPTPKAAPKPVVKAVPKPVIQKIPIKVEEKEEIDSESESESEAESEENTYDKMTSRIDNNQMIKKTSMGDDPNIGDIY